MSNNGFSSGTSPTRPRQASGLPDRVVPWQAPPGLMRSWAPEVDRFGSPIPEPPRDAPSDNSDAFSTGVFQPRPPTPNPQVAVPRVDRGRRGWSPAYVWEGEVEAV